VYITVNEARSILASTTNELMSEANLKKRAGGAAGELAG
jgi:hypothetical protein